MKIPDGWQLVPKDPTPEMLRASKHSTKAAKTIEACDRAVYAAMLGAALAPPTGDVSDTVTIPLADYKRLFELVEFDDMLVICETCGAWLDRADPATATTDDYNGCWKVAAGEDSDRCKSYRAPS